MVHSSRRLVLAGGIICLVVWPGAGLAEAAFGLLKPTQFFWLYASPWVVVGLFGLWLIGMSVFAGRENSEYVHETIKKGTK